MNDPDLKLLIGLVLAIALGAAAWYYRDEIFAPPVPETPVVSPVPAEPVADEGPRYPMPEPMEDTVSGELVPLPTLDDSDDVQRVSVNFEVSDDIMAELTG